uniref:NAD-dependent epimerase/dehydratase domain-containing protein n=1 Tax=Psilocybe cubensis TaxID=181762 RepID=A0A8H7XUH4_PSICU
MPSVSAAGGPLVLVTGANGYIGTWLIQGLLEKGYTVRGTVRSEEKGKPLTEYFDSTPYGSNLELPGAFDEAVKGVDAIEHVASPTVFLRRPDDPPDALIVPAVEGTLGILRSAQKFGSKVKRIVLTSSIVALLPIFTAADAESGVTVPLDESGWADAYVDDVRKRGNAAGLLAKYCASKALAEKAAWEFYEKCKSEVPWDLVALNPATVLGSPLLDFQDGLTSSLQYWLHHACKAQPDDVLCDTMGFVDVHDVVAAHVAALEKEEAGGERIILCKRNEMYTIRPDLYDGASGVLPSGNPGITPGALQYTYNTTKAARILGIVYTDSGDTLGNTMEYFETRGFFGGGAGGNVNVNGNGEVGGVM